MAVPKKKKARSATRLQHNAFEVHERKRLSWLLNLSKCDNCWSLKKNHRVCSECWFYNWKQIITKKTKSNVTLVQA